MGLADDLAWEKEFGTQSLKIADETRKQIEKYYKLPDSGEREDLGTGAVREPATGKGRYDLISPVGLKRLAIHYENGARKYAERNWEHGIPASRCFSSAVRHLFQYLAGDNSEDHLAAAVWNIFCIMHYEQMLPEMIDLPGRGTNAK